MALLSPDLPAGRPGFPRRPPQKNRGGRSRSPGRGASPPDAAAFLPASRRLAAEVTPLHDASMPAERGNRPQRSAMPSAMPHEHRRGGIPHPRSPFWKNLKHCFKNSGGMPVSRPAAFPFPQKAGRPKSGRPFQHAPALRLVTPAGRSAPDGSSRTPCRRANRRAG